MLVTIFGLSFTLNPIAFTLPFGGGWNVYWYGIFIATGFLAALFYAIKTATRYELNVDRMLDVVLVTVPVAILCARTYYVIFDGEKLNSISNFFGFGDSSGFSGLAIYGGIIGAFVTGALMCKIRKVKILNMFDIASVGFLIGQAIGRWGNFTNQEAYGTFTGSNWWGMESTRTIREMGEGLVHPCFLYESIWCIIGFFVLNHFSKKRKFSGQIVLMYCMWYGFGRTFIELLRTDSLMIGNFKVSAILSFVLFAAATILLMVLHKKRKVKLETAEYKSIFGDDAVENMQPQEIIETYQTEEEENDKDN